MKKLILFFVLALVMQSCCIQIVPPYRGDAFTQIESIKNPMFSKNVGYFQYETNDVDELFYKEFLGDKYDKKNYHRFYYFENGEFVRTYETMTKFQ